MYPTSVSSGKQALQTISAEADRGYDFSLILLDYLMPGMDGMEFAEKLRSDPKNQDIRIILLSSAGQSTDKDTLEKFHISSFVSKPFKQSSLLDAITRALGISEEDSGDQPQTAESENPGNSVGMIGDGKKVLLVEDNKFNMVLAKKLFEKEGLEVETATDGSLAVEAVKSTDYDLIFMDVQMPVMGGFEATQKIRELQKASGDHTPIIAMTANAMDGDREKCLEAGMDDYISKPISPKKLSDCILLHITKEPTREQV